MSNYVKENINSNVLVVNEEIAKMVENIGIHETIKEMDSANLAHLATVLFVYKIRNGKKYHDELVKDIVVFALTKSKYNNVFNTEDNNAEINYDLNTHQHTGEMAKALINMFVNTTSIRKELIGLILSEFNEFQLRQASVATK